MRRYAKSVDENRPHRVGIAKAAIEGDDLEPPFTCFEHPARGIDARAFDELVRRDPASMSASDRALLAAHIALYKERRDVIHRGSLTRIAENVPDTFGYFALLEARGLALVAQTRFADHYACPPVKMPGVDPAGSYRIRLLLAGTPPDDGQLAHLELWHAGSVKTGAELLQAGVMLPLAEPETAWLISLERVA